MKLTPGRVWTCPEGHRHFICSWCRNEFRSTGVVNHNGPPVDTEDPKRPAFCDECYATLRARMEADLGR